MKYIPFLLILAACSAHIEENAVVGVQEPGEKVIVTFTNGKSITFEKEID